jgi:hypothetical protein
MIFKGKKINFERRGEERRGEDRRRRKRRRIERERDDGFSKPSQ